MIKYTIGVMVIIEVRKRTHTAKQNHKFLSSLGKRAEEGTFYVVNAQNCNVALSGSTSSFRNKIMHCIDM